MNVSGTTVSATGHKGGLGDGLYDKAGARPDLDLDFARTKSLKDKVSKEDLITFTRTTSTDSTKGATYVDENGLVKVASRNLISRSEAVTIGGYGPSVQIDGTSNTYTDNNVIAPDGSLTAGTWTGDSDQFAILYGRTNGTNAWIRNPRDYDHVDVGWNITSEWQRFYYPFTYPSDGNGYVTPYVLRNSAGGSIYFAGISGAIPNADYTYSAYYKKIGTKVYFWGGQINLGLTPTKYVRTQGIASGAPRFTHDPETLESKGLLIEQAATNVIANKNADSTDWTKTGISISSTLRTAPTGVNEANELVATIGNTDTKQMYHTTSSSNISALKYTFSVFLKKGAVVDSNDVSKALIKIGQSGTKANAEVDLTNGTINVTTGTGAIENYGNGWYRASVTTAAALSASAACNSFVLVLKANGQNTYTGAGESIYFYGPQLEAGEITTSYIPTSGQANGVTRSPDLASIEGDNFGTYRTNIVKNTSFRKASDGYLLTGANANCKYESYAGISPSGNYDALKITATGTGTDDNGNLKLHRLLQFITLDNSSVYNATVYLKAGTADRAALYLWDGDSNPIQSTVNLTAETINVGYGSNGSITDVGNGWYRISVTSLSTTVNGSPAVIVNVLNSAGAARYDANGESLFVWGLQVEKASAATEFIPSTDAYTNRQSNATFVDGNGIIRNSLVNLFPVSEPTAKSDWNNTGANATLTGNYAVAPDGTQTAARLVMPNVNNTYFGQHISVVTGVTYTLSIYLKSNHSSLNSIDIFVNDVGVNPSTETVTLTNEWVRYTRTFTPSVTGNASIGIDNGTNALDHLLWGAQVVKGTEAGDYYKTTGTQSGPPRYSHDPETLTPTGLYLEPAATNVWLNSEDVNSWSTVSTHGYAPTVDSNSALAPDGTQTADKVTFANITNQWTIKYQGTFTGTYTWSGWIKTADNTTKDIYLSWASPDSNRVHTFTATGEWQRFEAVVTPAGANVHIGNHHNLTPSSWNGGEFYIWGVQMEAGSVATSYIPTSGATVTRAADTFTSTATEVLDRANGTKPAFYTKNGLSVFSQFDNSKVLNSRIFEFGTGTTMHVSATMTTSNRLGSYQPNDVAAHMSAPSTALIDGENKLALRYAANDLKVFTNGNGGQTDGSVTTKPSTKLTLGDWSQVSSPTSHRCIEGTINRLTIWKTPFVNSKLDKLTS